VEADSDVDFMGKKTHIIRQSLLGLFNVSSSSEHKVSNDSMIDE
jgi:hypothetical protein